ncbi:MAG: SDR family oxidoreductase [Chloroflexi bacterium]|uniref:UDP-glucuronate decarboxylase n=1 Tax=Candidatus Chlorohelix allophototropha TaxID=3003348 RepID=A0A8T7LTS3_9CHLR|nr:SDR family oxidoreductase [Chloroflexota bacterium]WJW67311.1 SDR family oxidoreductase [Chloroflexota bacterium L227-S17]
MRVLVAGGAGFIGSHLCEALLAQGHQVIAIDNFITGNIHNIAHLIGHSYFEFHEHDIIEPLKIESGPVDAIFHLASPASPVGYSRHPIETHLVNSVGTHNLLKMALLDKAKFLITSTSEAYGDPLVHPQREDYWGNVNPVGPRSCYDESKRFSESLTMEYVRQFGLNARIVRLFNTYGPRNDPQDGRVVPNFIMQALNGHDLTIYGTGMQTRSFCYVSDLVAGLLKAMHTEGTAGEVINLGNPDERTITNFAQVVANIVNPDVEIVYLPGRVDDPNRRCPDITKARTLLNWEPKVSLEEGIRLTAEYFRELINKPLDNIELLAS